MASSPSYVAPQRWAIQPHLTDAPELWRDCKLAFTGNNFVGPQPITDSITRDYSTKGISYDCKKSGLVRWSASDFSYPDGSDLTWWCLIDRYANADQFSRPFNRTANTENNPYYNWDFEVFPSGYQSSFTTNVLTYSSGSYAGVHVNGYIATQGLILLQTVAKSANQLEFYLNGQLYGTTSYSAPNATYQSGDNDIYIGANSYQDIKNEGLRVITGGFAIRAWTADECAQLARDPFAMFRPRMRRVVVVSGNTGSIKQGAGSGYSFAPIIIAPAAFQATTKANDTQTSVAQIAAGITESVQSGDSDLGPSNVPVDLSAKATGNDAVDPIANAASAIAEGVRSGETWTATAQAYAATLSGAGSGDMDQATAQAMASVQSGASSSDTEKTTARGVYSGAITEGTQASSRFVAAVNAIAGVTDKTGAGDRSATQHTVSTKESASISDAVTTVISALVAIGEGSTASDKWSLNLAGALAHITEAVNASAVTTARSSVLATISERAKAGAIFSIKSGGYLVAGAITLVSALHADINLANALESDKTTYPALNADINLH